MPIGALGAAAISAGIPVAYDLLKNLFSSSRPQQQRLTSQAAVQAGDGSPMDVQEIGDVTRVRRFTPEVESALSQLLQTGLQGFQQPLDFEPIESEARRRFSEEEIPSLAQRFANLGAFRGSGFQKALGGAQAGLESRLAAQKSQFGLAQQQQLLPLLSLALQPRFDQFYGERGPSTGATLGAYGTHLLGQAIPSLVSGGLSFLEKKYFNPPSKV